MKIAGGLADPLRLSIMGSGDFDFGGEAVNPHVEVLGSGKVRIKSYRGNLTTEGTSDVISAAGRRFSRAVSEGRTGNLPALFYSCRSASIGSRRAARRAGKKPKPTPMTAENTKAISTMPADGTKGIPSALVPSAEAPSPSAMPTMPPSADIITASTRNCSQHVALARADGEADADLARALGDADQHDVHDADAADEKADRGDGGQEHA